MKKISLLAVVSSLLVSTFVLGSTLASAETIMNEAPVTKGQISFKLSDKITEPTDPNNPNKPGEIIIDGNKGTNGPLSIDVAPNLTFTNNAGEEVVEISSTDQTYFAKALSVIVKETNAQEERPNFVQVTDNRGGAEGWQLFLTQKEQFKTGDAGQQDRKELTGAVITFKNGSVKTISDSVQPKTPSGNIVIEPGTKTEILKAIEGEGAGTSLLVWGDQTSQAKSIELLVPGGTTKYADRYTTDLEWTLSNTPEN